MTTSDDSVSPSLCHRCARLLQPGSTGDGSFFVVRIEAFADPTPPTIGPGDLSPDLAREIDRLMDELDDRSERELMDQIHRSLTITLCGVCYRTWIEDPTS
jgi:hypothetical protein